MSDRGMNFKDLKQRNKSLILYLLNDCGQLSRKELAARMGLTPAAVTKLTAELIDDGLIKENGYAESECSGRREILLALKLDTRNILCINAERNIVTVSISDMQGKLKAQNTMPICEDVGKVIAFAKKLVEESGTTIDAVGVCIIGAPDDREYGIWNNSDLKRRFEEAFNVNAVVENNVIAFAKAELLFGSIKDDKSVLFFKWGPGVGSAIVANGRVFSGNDSGVAEIGHYIVKPDGLRCRCGRRGCLETEVNADKIIDEVRDLDIELCIDSIVTSDNMAVRRIVDGKLSMVALALLNTATILNAREVVLCGSMFSDVQIARRLKEIVKGYFDGFCGMKISTLNGKRNYIGAVAICVEQLFFNA